MRAVGPREASTTQAAKQEERETLLLNLQDIVFHEVKNQLLIVAGYSSRLHEHGELLPAEKVRSYARAIHGSSRHLITMAEDMLLLRRIEGGEVEMPEAWTLAPELLSNVTDLVRLQAQERGTAVHVERSPQVSRLRVNAPAAKIVVSCLLEDAVKYGRQGGRVEVGCEAVSGERVILSVEDDGAGIPEGELDRVFDKFYRGTNTRHTTKGTGLGLYFAKTLTGALGGFDPGAEHGREGRPLRGGAARPSGVSVSHGPLRWLPESGNPSKVPLTPPVARRHAIRFGLAGRGRRLHE